ncbi:MAG TPA: formylglycine-generating enzyme family protein [Kofleriaceae bacterium]
MPADIKPQRLGESFAHHSQVPDLQKAGMIMRLLYPAVLPVLSLAISCDRHWDDLQCEADSNCDLAAGGVCSPATTGHHWCAYPDPSCSSGYRYSDVQVGDGASGTCVAASSDGDGGAATSCIALPSTCGPGKNGDCCESPLVSGGAYLRSYDTVSDGYYSDKYAPATISSVRLDKYEVTVGRFRAFLAEGLGTQAKHPDTGKGAHKSIPGSGWEASWNSNLAPDTTTLATALKSTSCSSIGVNTWTDMPGRNENLPINCVTWYEAMAFCVWDGGYLPSEAEWNYAAAGGSEQRAYPWSTPPGDLTIDISHASYDCMADGYSTCRLTDIMPVGSTPAGDGRWGQSDLAGNVYELLLDYGVPPYLTPCTDCANLQIYASQGGARIIRGGSYGGGPDTLRTGFRLGLPPLQRDADVGFRCARPAP